MQTIVLSILLIIVVLVAVLFAAAMWIMNRTPVDRDEDDEESDRRAHEIVQATGPAALETWAGVPHREVSQRPRVRAVS